MSEAATFVCGGCRVNNPWEHKCHGKPCRCPDCMIECTGCGREAPEWEQDWAWGSPHPSDGLPPVHCDECQRKEAEVEKKLGLDREQVGGGQG